jgi:hypothetical protein
MQTDKVNQVTRRALTRDPKLTLLLMIMHTLIKRLMAAHVQRVSRQHVDSMHELTYSFATKITSVHTAAHAPPYCTFTCSYISLDHIYLLCTSHMYALTMSHGLVSHHAYIRAGSRQQQCTSLTRFAAMHSICHCTLFLVIHIYE